MDGCGRLWTVIVGSRKLVEGGGCDARHDEADAASPPSERVKVNLSRPLREEQRRPPRHKMNCGSVSTGSLKRAKTHAPSPLDFFCSVGCQSPVVVDAAQ